eukprot:GFUD01015448.1.p1 GENE.GFUD01015448.1~~GFUD01015448.1.p1  ORF type:complete len:317 (+),score=68.45 GFUD01015448.1:34-984(+)
MDLFLMSLPPILVIFLSNKFATIAILNGVLQLIVFLLTANIPALVTGRMSYVDIAWPWGLVTIGLMPFLNETPENDRRANFVLAAYLVAGSRMAFGGAVLFFIGKFQTEFPRYNYQRMNWAKLGITDESSFTFKLIMQKEIIVQCLANMGALCMPLMIQAFGYKTGELTWLEVCGWTMWLLSIVFEHTADKQKKQFVKDCLKNNVKNTVCDVGLWRYSRHPNYFGEWMVWNSLIITSLPSLLALWQTPEESLFTKVGVTWGLATASVMMYQCLVNYTGAVPAEFYTVQKRPDYVKYQNMVNMFVPGPRREVAKIKK